MGACAVKFLRIKNWEEFQQYKDRDPKWIKLHRDILDDYDFDGLTEVQQCHLIKIWLLAAKIDNKIPNDAKWVARKIGAQSKVELDQLVTAGFMVPYSSVQDCTETYIETEEETEKETEEDQEANASSPAAEEPQPEPRYTVPMTGGKSHPIFDEDVDKYRALFPLVDVDQSIRTMLGWLDANSDRRSTTVKGVKQRLTGWITRDQEKASKRPTAMGKPRLVATDAAAAAIEYRRRRGGGQ
jgi:hypothetical protein